MVRVADKDPVSGVTTYYDAVQATFPELGQNDMEQKVSINPTNLDNIVLINHRRDTNFERSAAEYWRIVVSTSFDGGQTWPIVQEPWPVGKFSFDPYGVFDSFGNCFIMAGVNQPYADGSPIDVNSAGNLEILGSTDGGATFPFLVADIPPADFEGGGFPDFPKMAVGPDGTGSGAQALWFCYDDADFTNLLIYPTIGYVPIQGLGAYGEYVKVDTFTNIPISSLETYSSLSGKGQVFVNPVSGAVYYTATNGVYEYGIDSFGYGNEIYLYVNPAGTVDFRPHSFLPKKTIQRNNMGVITDETNAGAPFGVLSPWSYRGQQGFAIANLGYDATIGRLWFLGIDRRPAKSLQYVILLAYSDNEGQTWSNQIIVNKDQTVSVGIPTLAVEPTTGYLAIGWYDPRNSKPAQDAVEYFGAFDKVSP